MKTLLSLSITLMFSLLIVGCKPAKGVEASTMPEETSLATRVIGDKSLSYMPKARIFKMSGDYADKVAVSVGPGGTLTYYPAPSDLTADSAPFALGDGWYLDRQGFGSGAVFTKWTFAEYMALPAVPSPEEIEAAIIPGAKVTEMVETPIPQWEAMENPELCKKYAK